MKAALGSPDVRIRRDLKKLNYALHRVGTLLYAGCFQAKRGRSFLHRSHCPWLMILIIHTLVEEALAIIFGVKRFYL